MTISPRNKCKIVLSAVLDGRIRATVQRERKESETVMFNTILDFWEWPEIEKDTVIIFSSQGLVPKLNVPYQLILFFCSPDEIKTFVALIDAGDQTGWISCFRDLVIALDAEQFPIYKLVGTSVDLSHLIHNPKGYTLAELCRVYRDDWFW